MYFAPDLQQARRTQDNVSAQIPLVRELFDRTLTEHPDWWCRRASPDPARPKRWRTFFIEFPYRDIAALNRAWETDRSGRFRKRRELFWVTADRLVSLYRTDPDRLWKRVRQLEQATETILAIQRHKER